MESSVYGAIKTEYLKLCIRWYFYFKKDIPNFQRVIISEKNHRAIFVENLYVSRYISLEIWVRTFWV